VAPKLTNMEMGKLTGARTHRLSFAIKVCPRANELCPGERVSLAGSN
jgi:hypothetical protein